MTEIELLLDFHREAKRQGPGDGRSTLKALASTSLDFSKNIKIADIGCGTGAQTLDLARMIKGSIVAVDLFPEFLSVLNKKVEEASLTGIISTLQASMDSLPFQAEEFDLLWSEGAIYNIGFENGLRMWKPFLKQGGCIAVSEISWLTPNRPDELNDYWKEAYPEISTVSEKINVLERNGYSPLAHFVLPESCWKDNYYNPMKDRFDAFLKKHSSSKLAMELVNNERKEIALYEKYKEFYSYGFYIAKKL